MPFDNNTYDRVSQSADVLDILKQNDLLIKYQWDAYKAGSSLFSILCDTQKDLKSEYTFAFENAGLYVPDDFPQPVQALHNIDRFGFEKLNILEGHIGMDAGRAVNRCVSNALHYKNRGQNDDARRCLSEAREKTIQEIFKAEARA